jgi:hypothetical protein
VLVRFFAVGQAGNESSGSEAGLEGNSLMEYSFVLEIRESISQPAGAKEQCYINIEKELVLDIEGNSAENISNPARQFKLPYLERSTSAAAPCRIYLRCKESVRPSPTALNALLVKH